MKESTIKRLARKCMESENHYVNGVFEFEGELVISRGYCRFGLSQSEGRVIRATRDVNGDWQLDETQRLGEDREDIRLKDAKSVLRID